MLIRVFLRKLVISTKETRAKRTTVANYIIVSLSVTLTPIHLPHKPVISTKEKSHNIACSAFNMLIRVFLRKVVISTRETRAKRTVVANNIIVSLSVTLTPIHLPHTIVISTKEKSHNIGCSAF